MIPRHDDAILHDAAVQVRPDQPQYASITNALL